MPLAFEAGMHKWGICAIHTNSVMLHKLHAVGGDAWQQRVNRTWQGNLPHKHCMVTSRRAASLWAGLGCSSEHGVVWSSSGLYFNRGWCATVFRQPVQT